MAIARQGQNSTMLYTVIMFVTLFVITTILAVVFYLKSEDWRNQYVLSQQEQSKIASQNQVRNITALVGQKERSENVLGQLLGYIDQLYVMFFGLEPQETSAEVKVSQMKERYKDALAKIPQGMLLSAGTNKPGAVDANSGASDINKPGTVDINEPGAISLIEIYHNRLKQNQELIDDLTGRLNKLNEEYDIARDGSAQREKELRTQIKAGREDANSVQQSYNQLRELMNKETTEQVQALMKQRDEAIEDKNKTKQESLANLSKLSIAQDRLQEALSKLDVLKPRPKEDIAAYQPDGHVITVDTSSNIVFIDLGREDKVYAGLTFSVYDRNAPVPTDGSSKAEIEVFSVEESTAIARINKSTRKNPVTEDDVIINLIWDSRAVNRFVVAGEFDFDGDGNIDSDGSTKIKQLIENWGGKVENIVTIDTDFVILGAPPQVNKKPTLDEIETDSMAMDKYEMSIKASEQYQEVKNQAKDLFIPVFGVRRFLNFIGYESTASNTRQKAK